MTTSAYAEVSGMFGTVPAAGVDQPPWDMTTPLGVQQNAQWAIGAVVVLMLAGAVWHWTRTGRPTGVLLLVGGLFCSLNEALVDVLGHCHFPKDGAIAYTAFDRAVPWWVVTAYVAFFGGLTWLSSELLRAGVSRRTAWVALLSVWVLNLVLEMPILAAGLYLYYGDQPFTVGGFPLSWIVINSLGSLFGAVATVRMARAGWLRGARQAVLLVVPWATYFTSWVISMPYFLTMNAEVGTAVRWVAAAVCMLLGLVGHDLLIRLGVWPSRAPAPDERRDTPGRAAVPA